MNIRELLTITVITCACGPLFASEAAEKRLADIQAVMAARESATLPFWAKFEVVDERRDGTFWPSCSRGWVYYGPDSVVLRRTTWRSKTADASPFDEAAHVEVEVIEASKAGSPPLQVSRNSGAPNTAWSGSTSPRKVMQDGGPALIAHFGLICLRRRISDLVAEQQSAIVDEVQWQGFDCVRVVVDFLNARDEETSSPSVPLLLWLSKKHGYYPVRVICGIRADQAQKYSDSENLTFRYRDQEYRARSDVIVDELKEVSGVWLPVRARERVLFREGTGMITCRVDPESLRVGEIPAELYALDEVERAVIRDTTSGKRYFIGKHPYDVSEDRLESLSRGTGGELYGLHRLSPPSTVPTWLYIVVPLVCVVLGFLAIRAFRSRRSRAAGLALVTVLAVTNAARASDDETRLRRSAWIPVELETSMPKCAANCCYIALRDCGVPTSFGDLSAELVSPPDSYGVALNVLRDVLEERGVRTRTVSMRLSTLLRSGFPAVVFLGDPDRRIVGHYVIVRPDASGTGYEVVDPPNITDSAGATLPLDRALPMILYSSDPIAAAPATNQILALALFGIAAAGLGVRLGWRSGAQADTA